MCDSISLVRQQRWRHRSTIQWRRNSSSGRFCAFRQPRGLRPLQRFHPSQCRVAEHTAVASARGGKAVAGAARRRDRPPLHRRATCQCARSACDRARAAGARAIVRAPRAKFARYGNRLNCRPELEAAITDAFGDDLTAADDIARMDRRIGAKDFDAATRAAKRLGPAQIAIVKACEAVEGKLQEKRGAARSSTKGSAR